MAETAGGQQPEMGATPPLHPEDTLTVVNLVLHQIQLTEQRLIQKIDDNSRLASHRWERHEAEHATLVNWIKRVERDGKETAEALQNHLEEEADRKLVHEARFGPVRRAGFWALREWRTVTITVVTVSAIVLDRLL